MPARDLPKEKLTPADDLREVLRQLEIKIVALRGVGAEVVSYLHLMDEAQSLFQRLEELGVDLRAERSRWETIEQQLSSRAALLVRETRAAGGLAQLRETTKPTPDRWWWYLDEEVRRRRWQAFRRMAVGGIVALFVLAVINQLYQRFLAPDPITKRAYQLSLLAERAVQEGDLEKALAEYEALRELTPEDPGVFLQLGVVYEVLDREDEATQAYARAQELLLSQEEFFVERGMVYLQFSQWESAQADAEAVLALDADSVMAYWILGSAYEALNQVPEAVQALQQAADLADAQGNDALYALIKVRLGVLLGGGGGVGP